GKTPTGSERTGNQKTTLKSSTNTLLSSQTTTTLSPRSSSGEEPLAERQQEINLHEHVDLRKSGRTRTLGTVAMTRFLRRVANSLTSLFCYQNIPYRITIQLHIHLFTGVSRKFTPDSTFQSASSTDLYLCCLGQRHYAQQIPIEMLIVHLSNN
ncbi:hypothetical protein, partial [Bifidobacterium sp. UTBIF-56]